MEDADDCQSCGEVIGMLGRCPLEFGIPAAAETSSPHVLPVVPRLLSSVLYTVVALSAVL